MVNQEVSVDLDGQEYQRLRLARIEAVADIHNAVRVLNSLAGRIKLWENADDDAEWPVEWPIPPDVSMALVGLGEAVDWIDRTTAKAKTVYRMRVLEWLLAEERHRYRDPKVN